jgi:hypothetical protein
LRREQSDGARILVRIFQQRVSVNTSRKELLKL